MHRKIKKNIFKNYYNFVDIENVCSLSDISNIANNSFDYNTSSDISGDTSSDIAKNITQNANENIESSFLINEDECFSLEFKNGYFSSILDNVGAGELGNLIRQICIDAITRVLNFYEKREPKFAVVQALKEANRLILLRKTKFSDNDQISVIGVHVKDRELCIANVGNCRAYLIRDDIIRKLNKEHTYIQELLESGITPTKEEIEENKNTLTRMLGSVANIDIATLSLWIWDSKDCDVDINDVILLCSDGFYNAVSEEEIMNKISECEKDYKLVGSELLDLAKSKNTNENISLAIVPLKGQLKNVLPLGYKEIEEINNEARIKAKNFDIDNYVFSLHLAILTILFNFISILCFYIGLI
ncbi:MAG: PP2C family protein-serine/threonine phosphatase [Bdellovibrionota bacterium]